MREELFKTYIKTLDEMAHVPDSPPIEDKQQKPTCDDTALAEQIKKDRRDRAVREREEQVRAKQRKTKFETQRTLANVGMEEGESVFACVGFGNLPLLRFMCIMALTDFVSFHFCNHRTLLTDAIRNPKVCSVRACEFIDDL